MHLPRLNALLTAAAWALSLAAASLHLIVSPVLPPRVNVRWSDAASAAERARAEQELGLTAGELQDGRTWSYVLRTPSSTNVGRLIRHPLVTDTHHIDRATAMLTVEQSGQPAWVAALARFSAVQALTPSLPNIASVCGVLGLVGLWPIWRRVIPAGWRQTRRRVAAAARETSSSTRHLLRASREQWRDIRANGLSPRGRVAVLMALIMTMSLGLRIVLVVSGGQFYWGDESRYSQSRQIADALGHGDVLFTFQRMGNGQHPLFGVIGAVPAVVERLTHEDPRIPGVFFAVFSTLNIGLLALIAKRCGATDAEALVAGGLLALCNSFFYYARHLLPYDVAMCAGLWALCIGLGRGGRRSSVLCGVAAACTFLTYTGYWTLGGIALVMHVIGADRITTAIRRAAFGALGLAGTIGVVVVGCAMRGKNLAGAFFEFSHEIHQGDFSEGWSLPWEYLWHAEHLMLGLWLFGVVWALARARSGALPRSAYVGLLAFILAYVSLAVLSAVTQTFVVYGRLARQMVPFLCLVTASALYGTFESLSPRVRAVCMPALAGLLIAQAVFNFQTPLRQTFPAEFLREARDKARVPVGAELIGINTKYPYPGPEPVILPPRYSVLAAAPHPLQFLPYQYEGFNPAQRRVLRSANLEMRLILVPGP
jgi:xanthosine utilization system XapX-like protein